MCLLNTLSNLCTSKYSPFRALLQKRPTTLRSLLIVATPYISVIHAESCINSAVYIYKYLYRILSEI